MRTNLLEIAMGAVVLIVCGVFIILAYSTSQWKTVEGYEITAKFSRVDGLVKGSDVRLSGVKVGIVKDITLDPATYLAVVRMSLSPDVALPVDSSAEITSESLLGGKFLALVPGGEDATIPAGGEIFHTQAPVNLEALIGQFMFNSQEEK